MKSMAISGKNKKNKESSLPQISSSKQRNNLIPMTPLSKNQRLSEIRNKVRRRKLKVLGPKSKADANQINGKVQKIMKGKITVLFRNSRIFRNP
jgi:hypothetical protein